MPVPTICWVARWRVQGHLAEATRHLERAIQIDPSDQEARAYLERITQGYK